MLNKAIEYISNNLYKLNLELVDTKEISYGVQLRICDTNTSYNESLPMNVYYSKKNGISVVVGGSDESPIKRKLQKLAGQVKVAALTDFSSTSEGMPPSTLHKWKKWIGTDESGKGDFFGPLVASGFYCDSNIVKELAEIGVVDSKRLKDKQITKIAHLLYGKYKERIETIVLLPEVYNKLYADFLRQNKKLNELLAWMHSRIIVNLAKKFSSEGAIIDKFVIDSVVKGSLKDMDKIKIVQFPRAERDLAVAAASIIARYHFINGLSSLSKKFAIQLPRGASSVVIDVGKEFVNLHSKDKLVMVCKTHFKTYQEVLRDI